ncbi:hypothetical protein [Pandoraea oxalativorans]|uniref:YubB ferredoxin-like domain-containing protein n=1 Tax=Pandoraea oxalativorans TaxID=573737 RepID=A0A0G3ICG0_9BURK|nr:hypothetical protein [Pandoraea oxalativorans]AKK24887.1 hypothetical protein MB84_29420 [Pandoraea oxalativorans]
MANWVTTKIAAPPHVLAALLNTDRVVDFSRIEAFSGTFAWNSVHRAAETLAEIVVGRPLSDHPELAALEAENRAEATLGALTDEAFEQFVQMLRNHRHCGFFHEADFAYERWGTARNAVESSVDLAAGTASFQTAWACPTPVLYALSKQFPGDRIDIQYADEDVGRNCGMFALLGGEVVQSDIAPLWDEPDDGRSEFWHRFACALTGRDPDAIED